MKKLNVFLKVTQETSSAASVLPTFSICSVLLNSNNNELKSCFHEKASFSPFCFSLESFPSIWFNRVARCRSFPRFKFTISLFSWRIFRSEKRIERQKQKLYQVCGVALGISCQSDGSHWLFFILTVHVTSLFWSHFNLSLPNHLDSLSVFSSLLCCVIQSPSV